MNDKAILFYDSGVGGLSYLSWLAEREPEERFVYFADTGNFPYGEKAAEELLSIILLQMNKLIERVDPKMAVIACNTASVVALNKLREKFCIPFVGTVPAIKTAAGRSIPDSKNSNENSSGSFSVGESVRIGLLATSRTVTDRYTDRLIDDFASHCEIFRYGAGELVRFVERNLFSSTFEERMEFLQPVADYFIEKKIDALVLGCTHFIFLKEELAALMGESVEIVDSVDGVGRQIQRILHVAGRRSLSANSNACDSIDENKHIFLTSQGEENDLLRLTDFAHRFRLEYGGDI
ncbi:MAG: glutamate racemase [Spirochaetales bacterium]|nr:glutamate racemase [Spirochaetales bacterium]